jgi:hypothetical protein
VCAVFYDSAFFHYYNLVGIADGAEAVGNDYNGLLSEAIAPSDGFAFAPKKHIQIIHNFSLVLGIQGICGFVKKYILWIFINGTGNEQSLPHFLRQKRGLMSVSGTLPTKKLPAVGS